MATPPTTEPLAPLDLALWHAESANHPMHLGALAMFAATAGTPVDGAGVAELLAERASAVPQLRMRVRHVSPPFGGAVWTADEHFDIRQHVRWLPLPEGSFTSEAKRLAGELMARPLRRDIPPWEMYVLTPETVEPARTPDEQHAATREAQGKGSLFAVLMKLQHALADGMGAVAIGAAVFDQAPAARAGSGRSGSPRRPGRRQLAGRIAGVSLSAVRARRFDPRGVTTLRAPSSGRRGLGTAVLDLDDIRRIRGVTGGTSNDVLLATVAGALRRWTLHRGDRLPAAAPRALVPVSLRGPGRSSAPGNKVSAYLLDLPVTEPEPLARLTAVRNGMDSNKAAGPTAGIGAIAVLLDQLPPVAQRFGAPVAARAAGLLFDIAVTSVLLPRSVLSLGGCTLQEVFPMAPLAHGQSLAVALATYAGRVHVGLLADGKAVPDVGRLADCVHEELAELLRSTRDKRSTR